MARRRPCRECARPVDVTDEVARLAPFHLLCLFCVHRLRLSVHNDDGHWHLTLRGEEYHAVGDCFVHSDNPVATRLWLTPHLNVPA